MATVQYYDGTSWVDLETSGGQQASAWEITRGVSTVQIAPQATIETAADAITTNTDVRIRDKPNSETLFRGYARSGGRIAADGSRTITCDGYGTKALAEDYTINIDSDDQGVVFQVIESADAEDLTLFWTPAEQNVNGSFSRETTTRKRICRDIMRLRDYVWRIEWDDTADRGDFIVETKGGRGSAGSLTIGEDAATITQYESGSVQTVVNKAIVRGKGSQSSIEATATDQASIDTYGEQPTVFKSSWVATQADAQDLADKLLTPDPLPQATIQLDPAELGTDYGSLVNYTVDVTDPNRGLDNATLRIEQQTVTEGGHELKVGAGSGIDIERQSQKQSSEDDGSVVDLDDVADSSNYARIAENGVTANSELLADAVNLQDSLGNLDRKLQELVADDGTKNRTVIDGAEILTGSITAAEIFANTITANEISAGSIDASRLQIFDWIPDGLTFTDNDPGAGEISWTGHDLTYNGTTYAISSGSTAQEFVYWQEGDGFYSTSDTKPTLGDGDALIAVNDGGEAVQILQATIIDGGSIRTNSIQAAEIEAGALTADEIQAGSIDATRLQIFDWIPVGLTFSDNSPGAGDISWNSHTLTHDGTTYNINAGSTSDEFVYWQEGNGFYSTSNTKPTLADGDALIAVNDGGEAVQILQATIIDGGSIRTNSIQASEIEAETITALEIAGNTITANEIDVLNLNAGELTVGEDADEGPIVFSVRTPDIPGVTTSYTVMEPGTDERGNVGSSTNRFGEGWFNYLDTSRVGVGTSASTFALNEGEIEVFPTAASGGMRITTDSGAVSVDDVSVQPNADDDGMLGAGDGSTSSQAWQEIHTHNLYQYTPKPMSDDPRATASAPKPAPGVNLDSLQDHSWGNPPDYVQAGKKNGEYVDVDGAVEMSHMANYLLETCKAQQSVIDTLEEEVDDLEERLSTLEQEV